MKTTIHCDERITNIRNSIYVKLFWDIIILDTLAYLLDYFFQTSLNGWVIPLAPCVLIIWMSIKGVLFNYGFSQLRALKFFVFRKMEMPETQNPPAMRVESICL